MKYKCSKCKKIKSKDNFYFSKGKVNGWCKECFRKDHRNKYTPSKGQTDDVRKCRECEKEYAPKLRTESFFCSRDCKDKNRKKELKAERIASKSDRLCVGCRKTIPRSARADKKWCSEDCASKARGHTMNVTRRIRTKEPIERFRREDIYERDNWICQICKKPVDKKLSYPDLNRASLDHVNPLSRGGTHESQNVQLTHLLCNVSRGNRAGDESTRPALLKDGRKIFTIPEAARLTKTSLPVLQRAVALGRIKCEPRKKFESRYLSEETINDILEVGIPGSLVWKKENKVEDKPRVRTYRCKQCGKDTVVEISLGSRRSYCSLVCYQTSLRNRKRVDPKRLTRIKCSICKGSIKGRKQVKQVNLCSTQCINEHRKRVRMNKLQGRFKSCLVCASRFPVVSKPGHPTVTCSAKCAIELPRIRARKWHLVNGKSRLRK